MLDERSLRRADFAHGVSIRLADRQFWSFPTPDDLATRGLDPNDQMQYQALTRGIIEAESRSEMLQAELALTIFLLGRNYELNSTSCYQALCFPPGDPLLSETQQALHTLSMDHVRARRSQFESRPAPQPAARTSRLGFLRRTRASASA